MVREVLIGREDRQLATDRHSTDETELLRAIHRGIPADLADRHEALVQRRRSGTLTEDEHAELVRLTDQIEAADAERLAHLASLSRLRGVPLAELLESLGIRAREYS